MGILQLELHLPPALLDQVIEQQRGQVPQVVVSGVLGQVQDFRQWTGLTPKRSGSFIAEPLTVHNAPKGGGDLFL